jgi:hypothetical protein
LRSFVVTVLLLTVLHAAEALAWARAYVALGARPDLASAILYSLSAMTSYGHANLPLHVLPPRSPKLNGAVERCNGAWRYEVYARANPPTRIDRIGQLVEAFQRLCNRHKAPWSPRRKAPSRIPLSRPSQRNPTVPYVLSQAVTLAPRSALVYPRRLREH